MKSIQLAVLGGSGKAGRYLVQHLQQQGYSLKLLLRHPDRFPADDPPMELIQGDARDAAAIRSLLAGCHAVVSTLGQPRGEAPIFHQATRLLLKVMPDYHIRRYITVTGLQVDTPYDTKSPTTRAATDWMKASFPVICADRQREYELLAKSAPDWTLVRLPRIEQTDARFPLRVRLEDAPGEKISATDLAYFLTAQLEEDTYVRQAPFIGNETLDYSGV